MSQTKILITGATGYIGGSVLTTLLSSTDKRIGESAFTALVRKSEHADVLKARGVNAVLFSGLDDVEHLKKVASEHDVVINTASAFQPQAADAIIQGLAERQSASKKPAYLIHTSGTSSLGNRPITGGGAVDLSALSDKDDVYAFERKLEDTDPYAQRTTDLVVFERGDELGVKTYILTSPTIYGQGTGLFNRNSIQIPAIMRAAAANGYTSVIGKGAAMWDHVHIADLVKLYELILTRLLSGDDLPHNKSGIYFNETGHHSWREIADRVAKSGHALGFVTSGEVREVSLEDGAKSFGKTLKPEVAELGFASHSRTTAQLAREIGWKPTKTRTDFEASFDEEWRNIMEAVA